MPWRARCFQTVSNRPACLQMAHSQQPKGTLSGGPLPSPTPPQLRNSARRHTLSAPLPRLPQNPEPSLSRIIQIGDASGIQSPLSFGGFGALMRHARRLVGAIDDALKSDALTKCARGTGGGRQRVERPWPAFLACLFGPVGRLRAELPPAPPTRAHALTQTRPAGTTCASSTPTTRPSQRPGCCSAR